MLFRIQLKFCQNIPLVIVSSDSRLPRAYVDVKYLLFQNNKNYFIFGKLLSENLHLLTETFTFCFFVTDYRIWSWGLGTSVTN